MERVEEIASKLPRDIPQKRPIIERIAQRFADLPKQVPELPVLPAAELDRLLAGAEIDALLPRRRQTRRETVRRRLHRLRQMDPPDSGGGVPTPHPAIPAGHGRRTARKAAKAPGGVASAEPPQLADLPASVTCRFVGKTGRYLMQVYGKANIWDVGPMGQFVDDVRSVDPNATGNPVQVYEASRQMKRSFEQAACYALLMIVPGRAPGFPPAQPYAAGRPPDGRRPAPDVRADGPAWIFR